jgi:hypothetical protein
MSQEDVDPDREALEELAWIWDASLSLVLTEAYPRERWLLEQRGRPVAAIEETAKGWSLATATQRCSAGIRRRRRRLGWHMEVTPSGERSPALHYRPATVRTGGTLTLASGGRYKLRRLAGSVPEWTLANSDRDMLACISLRTDPPSGSEAARDQTRLAPAAARERHLSLLLAAAGVAMVIHYQQPRTTGEAGL